MRWIAFGALALLAPLVLTGACTSFGQADTTAAGDAATTSDAAAPGDASVPLDSGSDAGCVDCRIVFVSTTQPKADFGGVPAADSMCQSEANNSNHPAVAGRKFHAWLSDAMTTPADRFAKGTGQYMLPSGQVVAKDWLQLTTGGLIHAIDENASGVSPPSGSARRVWTGTKIDGSRASTSCSGWTTRDASANATTGLATATNGSWTDDLSNENCSDDWPIYCFER